MRLARRPMTRGAASVAVLATTVVRPKVRRRMRGTDVLLFVANGYRRSLRLRRRSKAPYYSRAMMQDRPQNILLRRPYYNYRPSLLSNWIACTEITKKQTNVFYFFIYFLLLLFFKV